MHYWNGREWADEVPRTAEVKREGRAKRIVKTMLEVGLVTTLAFGLIAGSTFAGRSGGSIALDATSLSPTYGGKVHFTVSTGNAYPVVSVTCSQGGVVYGDSRPYYSPNPWNDPGVFTLASLAWTGGAADCTAYLKVTRKNGVATVATTSFHVMP